MATTDGVTEFKEERMQGTRVDGTWKQKWLSGARSSSSGVWRGDRSKETAGWTWSPTAPSTNADEAVLYARPNSSRNVQMVELKAAWCLFFPCSPLLEKRATHQQQQWRSTVAWKGDKAARSRLLMMRKKNEGLRWGWQLVLTESRLEGNDGGGVSWSLPEHEGMRDQEEGTGKWGRRDSTGEGHICPL